MDSADDKFMVQTSVVSFEFFANELKDKDEKIQAAALVTLFKVPLYGRCKRARGE